mgnify:CR=1 FL=1
MMKVSVLIPLFNSETFIEQTIRSVIGQSWNDLEVIIVDDGSTDRTVELIEAFDDARISLIRAPHRGFIAALKLATVKAK